MKKLRNYYLSMLMIAGLGFLASCGDDDEPEPEKNPTIEFIGGTGFTSTDVSVAAGSIITVKVDAGPGQSGTNLERFTIAAAYNGASSAIMFDSTDLSGEDFQYTADIQTQQIAGTAVYTFTIEDNKGRTGTKSLTITTTSTATGDINAFNTQLFGSFNNPAPSFFATSNGTKYFRNTAPANSSKIDLVYFYGATNQATIASPNDNSFGTGAGQISSLNVHTWSTRNATTFKETSLSTTAFDAISNGTQIAAAYTGGTDPSPVSRVTSLAVADVFAFKTAAGKHGLIKVTNISGTTDGTITISVKVQK